MWSARITVPSGLNLTVLFNSDVDFVSAPYNVNGVMVQDWNFKQMKHAQSSYLVAIAVGQFDYVETNRGRREDMACVTKESHSTDII